MAIFSCDENVEALVENNMPVQLASYESLDTRPEHYMTGNAACVN